MKQQKKILRGEAALVLAVIINSLGVLLMLQSGSGISAISSVPYAFQQVFPKLTLGTWTYLFQGLLICILMIMRKKFVPSYLFSFVVGFAFGEMMDLHELWITRLPLNIPLRILYFVLSYLIICLELRCQTAANCRSSQPICFRGKPQTSQRFPMPASKSVLM